MSVLFRVLCWVLHTYIILCLLVTDLNDEKFSLNPSPMYYMEALDIIACIVFSIVPIASTAIGLIVVFSRLVNKKV